MKLSIWQQFSSNHSASFIVIGRFETIEQAQEKEAELRDLMYQRFWVKDKNAGIPHWKELEISAIYGVEWYGEGMLWNGVPDSVDDTVRRSHNDVFVVCPHETYDHPQPFFDLLTNMGAKHVVQYRNLDDYSSGISVDLKCVADDTKAAKQIYAIIKHALDEEAKGWEWLKEVPLPWAKFSPSFDNYAQPNGIMVEAYDKFEEQYIQEGNIWLANYRDEIIKSGRQPTEFVFDAYWQFRHEEGGIAEAIEEIRYGIRLEKGRITRKENVIEINSLIFLHVDIGLIALVRWMEDLGCEVTYQFRERDLR